jgi:autophagy-related protein 17
MNESLHSSTASSYSPPSSPTFPTLDDLIVYLLAAKRALSTSYSPLSDARSLVTSATPLLTQLAVLSARTTFLSRTLHSQLVTLRAIQHGLESVFEDGDTSFREVLAQLDDADRNMKECLTTLKNIVVTTVPSSNSSGPAQDKSNKNSSSLQVSQVTAAFAQKSLFDFVDETGVETILASFRTSIDHTTSAQDSLQSSTANLSSTLDSIADQLETATAATFLSTGSSHFGRDFPVTSDAPRPIGKKLEPLETAATFRAMEDHATEMAHLLSSLVTHYELCVKALRHTEGGSDAVAEEIQATQQSEGVGGLGLGLDLETASFNPEQSARRSSTPAAMTQDEREDMLRVLQNDASEVSDVVLEILERSASLTTSHSHIQRAVDALAQSQSDLLTATTQLAALAPKLPLYIEAGAIWTRRWEEERITIEEGLGELEGLRLFYQGFVGAYSALEGEVERRTGVRREVEKVLEEAMKVVRGLHEGKCDLYFCHCIRRSEVATTRPPLLSFLLRLTWNAKPLCQTTLRSAMLSSSSTVSFSRQTSTLSSTNSQSGMRSSRPLPPSHLPRRLRHRCHPDTAVVGSRSSAIRKISRRLLLALSSIFNDPEHDMSVLSLFVTVPKLDVFQCQQVGANGGCCTEARNAATWTKRWIWSFIRSRIKCVVDCRKRTYEMRCSLDSFVSSGLLNARLWQCGPRSNR